MKLRKPCEHGLYDWHTTVVYGADRICPGGVFLPDASKVYINWANEVTYDRRIYPQEPPFTEPEEGYYWLIPAQESE